MSELFDDLCRALGQPIARRTVFRLVMRSLAVSAASTFLPGRVWASSTQKPSPNQGFAPPCPDPKDKNKILKRALTNNNNSGPQCGAGKCPAGDKCCAVNAGTGYCCPDDCPNCSSGKEGGCPRSGLWTPKWRKRQLLCGWHAVLHFGEQPMVLPGEMGVLRWGLLSGKLFRGRRRQELPLLQRDVQLHRCKLATRFTNSQVVGQYLQGNCKTVCQCDCCGISPVGDASFVSATSGIGGSGLTCFNYCTSTLIQSMSFTSFQGALMGGGDFQASGAGTGTVNGVATSISFSANRISGVVSIFVTDQSNSHVLAGGTGEFDLADFGLEILN